LLRRYQKRQERRTLINDRQALNPLYRSTQ
jgi:hypothetical protein